MKSFILRLGLFVCLSMAFTSVASASVTVRLIYGESWSRAGRAVRNMLVGKDFSARSAEKGYTVDCQDESGRNVASGNLGTYKLPAIFLIDENDHCFGVLENVAFDTTAADLSATIDTLDARHRELEAAADGFASAEACGTFLEAMEPLVGGKVARITGKGFYPDVFAKLKELDPNDETGWQLRYTMDDGLSFVGSATSYRTSGNLTGGEAYVADLEAKVQTHLTTEQRQAISMARFALYRTDAEKTDEMNALLQELVDMDETTFWGTGALGWLRMRGVTPPLSIYWGWHGTDFSTLRISKVIRYGVDVAFADPGDYTVTLTRDKSSESEPVFQTLLLLAESGDVVAVASNVVSTNNTQTFSFTIPKSFANSATTMRVFGTNATTAVSSGTITVERRVRKARQEGITDADYDPTASDAGDFIREKKVGSAALSAICAREGGAAFLTKFFADPKWVGDFAGSGVCSDWARALKLLDVLVWNDDGFIDTPMGRRMATAFALNHPTYSEEKAVRLMALYRSWVRDGTIIDYAWDYDCYQWREALAFGQCSELGDVDFRFMHDFTNLDAARYPSLTWNVAYRLNNCFGVSVHSSDYYRPWSHRLVSEQVRLRVGGVCGSVSKFASHQAFVHGIRAFTAGQPGHCAYLVWDYDRDTWSIGFNVTAHTSPHFRPTTAGFQALLEAERYFAHPNRMRAEQKMWAGKYDESLSLAPGNWQAASLWKDTLSTGSSEEDWNNYGGAILRSFQTAPYSGWTLYRSYLDALVRKGVSSEKLLEAAKKGVRFFVEATDNAPEKPYLDEFFLTPLSKVFSADRASFVALIAEALEVYADLPTFYDQTVSWGLQNLMGANEEQEIQQAFMDALLASVGSSTSDAAFGSMVLRASAVEDVEIFHKVFEAVQRISPSSLRTSDAQYPGELNGGELLSSNGVLSVSSAWGTYNRPLHYLSALTADKFENGAYAFHTNNESAPWAKVSLPGDCGLTAIQVVNRTNNTGRQVPIRIFTSQDGETWTQVYESSENLRTWTVTFDEPVKAKYVKVDRTPGARSDCWHLDKILIYGDRHYGETEDESEDES